MRLLEIVIVVVLIGVAFFLGCTEKELNRADSVIQDVDAITGDIDNFINTPTGSMVAGRFVLIISLVLNAIQAASRSWRKIREKTASTL